ncbi:zinc finger CCCH-type antiviral protein 1-like [Erinaceus europaeus]|uniref:Zinc finger CCCH-type antiviral protein 1-like n=1 Tax=Erinaceus europaeus TaxID=9365 RepID=A0ABM3XS60_ERIEU|nr:zinc finger CCCH-type antiviral protein 1-like [Erinaceus europaeus]
MADPVVCSYITKVLCAHGGRLALGELLEQILLSEEQLLQVLEAAGRERFVLLDSGGRAGLARHVVATTRARVCRRKFCDRACDNLHLCKLNLLGRCHYSERKLCKYSHDVLSEHNSRILKTHELSGLNQEELAVLLKQSDPFFLPEICKTYKGEGRRQVCLQTPPCERLHICEHFTRGNCGFPNCLRSHNLLERRVLAVMEEHGLSTDTVQNIQDICNSKHGRRRLPATRGRVHSSHRRDPSSKERSKSRDQLSQGKQEFLSTLLTPLDRSCTPSPDKLDLLDKDEPVERLTQKLGCLGSQGPLWEPASVPSKTPGVAPVGADPRPLRPQGPVTWLQDLSTKESSLPLSPATRSPPGSPLRDLFAKDLLVYQAGSSPDNGQGVAFVNGKHGEKIILTDKFVPHAAHGARNVAKVTTHDQYTAASDSVSRVIASPVTDDRDSKDICLNHLNKSCQLRNCSQVHFHLPYQWQIYIDGAWTDLQPMETIEKAYCDPQNRFISVGNRIINFQKMICNSHRIRRLSTPSSVITGTNSAFTTKWLWYWKNESDRWVEYGERDRRAIDSLYLESLFQSYPRGVVPFQLASRSYELSFPGMIQTNTESKTQKDVVRRPVFVSSWDVEQLRHGPGYRQGETHKEFSATATEPPSMPGDLLCGEKTQPWARHEPYLLLELNSIEHEYVKVSERFRASMKNVKIEKIKKIFNSRLLTAFERKKKTMKKPNEEILFCASSRASVAQICANNFDWTLHGPPETRYGKGNYFTKDAISSQKICRGDPKNVMFIARVLVGNCIEGNKFYSSPPPMYDSCVDTRLNPSIFVIYEKDQIYPEYVIEYSEMDKACVIS